MKKAEKAELEIISADTYYGKTYDEYAEPTAISGKNGDSSRMEAADRHAGTPEQNDQLVRGRRKIGLKKLAIKVDIDTLRGYRGVPRMLDLFKKHSIRASIFFLLIWTG